MIQVAAEPEPPHLPPPPPIVRAGYPLTRKLDQLIEEGRLAMDSLRYRMLLDFADKWSAKSAKAWRTRDDDLLLLYAKAAMQPTGRSCYEVFRGAGCGPDPRALVDASDFILPLPHISSIFARLMYEV